MLRSCLGPDVVEQLTKVLKRMENPKPLQLDLLDRGHDNVHDDMNMYVIMHDQCLFIAMINIFHI